MRIKHKREYVIFRRTKMATAHRKCDECGFWFQSAKTYHQHRSQLPNQLPGENKGKFLKISEKNQNLKTNENFRL